MTKMKNRIIIIFTLLFSVIAICKLQAAPKDDECYNCHENLDGKNLAPAAAFKTDVHHLAGISCAGCHGGDSKNSDIENAMDKKKGYLGIPQVKTRYMVCVKCHSDKKIMQSYGFKGGTEQYEMLKESVHFKPSYNMQGPIADCITCHGAHGILKVKDPQSKVAPLKIIALCGSCHSDAAFMKKYNPGIPVDQVVKYRTSVHGEKNAKGDANTAQCVSCHGNHGIFAVKDARSSVYNKNIAKTCSGCHSNSALMAQYKIPTDQFEKYKNSVHGKALLVKGDAAAPSCNGCHGNHGATPPGVESISKVCGTCHAFNMELFEKSVHKGAFAAKNIPECESCHGNHGIQPVSDEFLGMGPNAVCIKCHATGSKGLQVATSMKQLFDTLNIQHKAASEYLDKAEQLGMDVSDEKYSFQNLKSILIKAKTSVHTLELAKFKDELNPGVEIVNDAEISGKKAIENYYFRRKGLAVATILVSLLVVLLFLKLKRIEKEDSQA